MAASKLCFSGKDMFLLPDGSTYHLEVKEGDIFPRILTVGSNKRAEAIAKQHLDQITKEIHSSRGFHIFSGYYKGVGTTIISIGMGAPMMDFMLREISFVHSGPLAIIRLGTCGLFNKNLTPGTVVTAGKGSMYIFTNYPYFYGSVDEEKELRHHAPYVFTASVGCDETLNECLIQCLKNKSIKTYDGLNASCETFYACQGRSCLDFGDQNDYLMKKALDLEIDSMEMETHQLFHLAKLRKEPCYVAGSAIGIVNRVSDMQNISAEEFYSLELSSGQACLDALVGFQLEKR